MSTPHTIAVKRPRAAVSESAGDDANANVSASASAAPLSVKERLALLLRAEERGGQARAGDSTEGTAVSVGGEDDDGLGGGLSAAEDLERRWERLNRQRRRGGHDRARDDRDDTRKTELQVDSQMPQPRFFSSGADFPVIGGGGGKDDVGEVEGEGKAGAGGAGAAGTIAALWQSGAEMDIIVPVAVPGSPLALAALRGSAALAELRRVMERERANAAVADTTHSDLAALQGGGGGGGPGRRRGGGAVPAEGDARAEEEEQDEVAALQRRLRAERARLERPGGGDSAAKGEADDAAPPGDGADVAEEVAQRQRRQAEARQRQRLERAEHIRGEDERLRASAASAAAAERRAELRATQAGLPIAAVKEELLRVIGENAITVVVGETGSGKTTQLVQYLYERGYADGGFVIGCTQPRRLAAIGVARRVSEEMGCALGTTVGYAIHLDDMTTAETQIKFMTDGVLLRECAKDPCVRRYSVVVLDEAHERSVDTDVLMGLLKRAIRGGRRDLKLIVTSATMDVGKFSRYFVDAPSFFIAGRTFEVVSRFSPAPVEDYVAEAVFRVCQLHLQEPLEGKHDILVFMTGRDDVHGTVELIRRRLADLSPERAASLVVLPCLSEAASLTASADAPFGVLDETPAGMRKCVVATNVAETSLTIDGVRHVIDCGFMKTNVFRPKIGMNTLQRYPVSQAQAGQRAGRAGRTAAGVCHRLYTEAQYAGEMLPSSVPEIQRSSVDSVVLLLKSIGVARIADFDFMDPPPAANVRTSMLRLWVLGLIDDDGAITSAGRLALEFPVAPPLAKLLVDGARLGCAVEAARIVSLIAADPKALFETPKGREEEAQQHHGRFYDADSDHLTLLNVFRQFVDAGRTRVWAADHFLHYPTLQRAADVFSQLAERMQRLRLPLTSCGLEGTARVRYCLARSFCLQAAQRSGDNWSQYRPLLNAGVLCHLHPTSAVCASAETPPYVVYNDLMLLGKEYMVLVTAVEPEWLVEAARGVLLLRTEDGDTVTCADINAPFRLEAAAAAAAAAAAVAAVGEEEGGKQQAAAATAAVSVSSLSPDGIPGVNNSNGSSSSVGVNRNNNTHSGTAAGVKVAEPKKAKFGLLGKKRGNI